MRLCGTLWLKHNILFDVGDEGLSSDEDMRCGATATAAAATDAAIDPTAAGGSSGSLAQGEYCGFCWNLWFWCTVGPEGYTLWG